MDRFRRTLFVPLCSCALILAPACDPGTSDPISSTGGSSSPAATGGTGTEGGAGSGAGSTGGATGAAGAPSSGGTAGAAPEIISAVVPALLEVGGTGDPGRVTIAADDRRPIPDTAYGLNYWSWVEAWGEPVVGTEPAISALNVGVLRIGGHNNDANTPEPFTGEKLDEAIAYARAVGAEPLVQVPVLADETGQVPTAATATEIVTYLNQTRGYGVKYFSIGNEPDLYAGSGLKPATYSAAEFCITFADFSRAMKAVDPSIQIVGPDLSYMYFGELDWLVPFLTDCSEDVDIVAVHRYPMDASQTTLESVLEAVTHFRTTIEILRTALDEVGVDKPLAITEANVSWNGNPANPILPGSPGTFLAGLWVADMIGAGLEEGLWTQAFWSISEGWTLGFITEAGEVRPAYHALRLYADHFGPTLVGVTSAPSGFDVYASRTAADDATAVIVVNKNPTHHLMTIEITGLAVSVPVVEREFSGYSISALEIPDAGTPRCFTYTEEDAAHGRGPRQME